MNTLPEIYPGQLYLILMPRALRRQAEVEAIARLALLGVVRILDGGNCFAAHQLARALRRQTIQLGAALQRVRVARAFTCHQVFSLLSETGSSRDPTLVLDLLSTFRDENVRLDERQRLFQACLGELRRLSRQAPVVVSAGPLPDEEAGQLLELLEEAVDQVWRFEESAPPVPARLF